MSEWKMNYQEVRRLATECAVSLAERGQEDFAIGDHRFAQVSRFVEAAVKLGIVVPTRTLTIVEIEAEGDRLYSTSAVNGKYNMFRFSGFVSGARWASDLILGSKP